MTRPGRAPTTAKALIRALHDQPFLELPDALALLRHRGAPATVDDLQEWLTQPGSEHLALLEVRDRSVLLDVPRTVGGRCFSHRLSAAEQAADRLQLLPDFAALWPVLELPPFDELDGELIGVELDEESDEAALVLPPGALRSVRPGSLVLVSVGQDGLRLSTAPEPARDALAPALEMLRETLGSRDAGDAVLDADELGADVLGADVLGADALDADEALMLEELLLLTCAEHPDAFTEPGWPVADLLALLDLDHSKGLIAAAGFDFDSFRAIGEIEEQAERIADTYELSGDEAAVVLAFGVKVDEVHEWLHEQDDDDAALELPRSAVAELRPLLPALSEPMVAVAIADEQLTTDPHLALALQLVLEALEQDVPRRAEPGWTWLSAKCSDVLGDVPGAELLYQRALDLDGDFYPAMRELAALASLRGDAAQAVSLLGRAGVPPEDPELQMLTGFIGEERPDVGRNDPCWCGSGRKYKRCHLGRSVLDLPARRRWMYQKVTDWIRSGYGRSVLIELAAAGAGPLGSGDDLVTALGTPLVMDIAMFEYGLLQDFLSGRGDALPAEEFDLLTGWLASSRRLYTAGQDGGVVTLTPVPSRGHSGEDARGGAGANQVRLTEMPPGSKAGGLVCARVLDTGGELTAPGGLVAVPADRRKPLAALLALDPGDHADPLQLITLLSAAGPRGTAGAGP